MEKFRRDAECKVFLSTDAGGVGLNLQAASAVINFEPPWNPARLEQRIGRVHRLGQAHPVHVVHLLTKDSIEERVWETLKLKKSLFAGVFDSPTGEVSFAALGRKSVLQTMKEIFANQPGRPKPLIDQAPPKAVPARAAAEPAQPPPAAPPHPVAPEPAAQAHGFEQHAGALIETGLRFLESLAAIVQTTPGRRDGGPAASCNACRAWSRTIKTPDGRRCRFHSRNRSTRIAWHDKVGGKTITESFATPALQRKAEREVAEFARYRELSRAYVDVNAQICRARPVEETLSPQEKKRPKRSVRKSRAK